MSSNQNFEPSTTLDGTLTIPIEEKKAGLKLNA